MREELIFEWEGKRIEYGERTSDWYFALGIIAVAAIIVALLFNNILLALVIGTGVTALILDTRRAPTIHRFAISDRGVYIDEKHYPYDSILSFSVIEYLDPALPIALSIKTKFLLDSHLMIPIVDHHPEDIYAYIEQHCEEGNHHEHFFDRLFESLKL